MPENNWEDDDTPRADIPQGEFADDAGFEFEEEPTDQREERVSPLILASAVVGLLVGLFLRGSLVMSVGSSAGDLLNDVSLDSEGAPSALDTVTPTPSAGANPSVTPVPDPSVNREDCEEIRGTDYRSPEERQWFLANCVEG